MTWTKTPPSAPDRYWTREFADSPSEDWTVTPVEEHDGKLLGFDPLGCGEDVTTMGVEWWPVPIPRPGEGTDWRAVRADMIESLSGLLDMHGAEDPDDEAARTYDAAVARHTKGATDA